jgi:hypothetical protein
MAWAAVVAVMEVLLLTITLVAAVPPSFTVAPGENPVPVMVTVAPPLTDPEFGVIAVTVGAGVDELNNTKLATEGTPALLIRNTM